jgi:hypothetical protein
MSESENSPNSSTESSDSRAAHQTLGVLFVHGIGSQRRGDTLLSTGTAVHSWLKRWYEDLQSGITVDVAESHLAEAPAQADAPAHARMTFAQNGQKSSMTWLLAESRWAETFFEPTFSALLVWCFRVLPWVPLFYVLPGFKRSWTLGEQLKQIAKSGVMTFDTMESVLRDPAAAELAGRGALFQGSGFTRLALRQAWIQLSAGVKFAGLAIASCLMAILLLFVFVLTIISFGLLRSLAVSVQRVLSATIGDSYFYVTNPVIRAAILTKVESDLAWLAKQGCTDIVIVAHSQGAAVAYDVIRKITDEKRRPKALGSLISYGSGLRRLFTLERALKNSSGWNYYSAIGFVLTAIQCVFLYWMITERFSILTAVTVVVVCTIVIDGALLGAARTFREDPGLLETEWTDYYASHDPVPGGALEIADPSPPSGEEAFRKMTIEEISLNWANKIALRNFYRRQRQVLNRGSVVMDHVSYWDAPDDFVAAVTTELMRRTQLPMQPWEPSWLEVARKRRGWRLSFLSACRTAAFIAIAGLLLSTDCLERAGLFVRAKTMRSAEDLEAFDWFIALPASIVGCILLSAIVSLLYAFAVWGWRAWDREEVTRFFLRYPYRQAPVDFRFAAGWLALTAFPPLASLAFGIPLSIESAAVWASAAALAFGITRLYASRSGPGTKRARALQLIEVGNQLLRDPESSGSLHANHVRACFSAAEKLLDSNRHRVDWTRAVLAYGSALEQLDPKSGPAEALALYRHAREVLEEAGKDSTELNVRIGHAQAA